MRRRAGFTHLEGGTRGYLDLSQLLLLLPVPDGQDVIVGIVHGAQEGATILRGRETSETQLLLGGLTPQRLHAADRLTDLEKATHVTALSNTPIPITWSVLRVTESQTRI